MIRNVWDTLTVGIISLVVLTLIIAIVVTIVTQNMDALLVGALIIVILNVLGLVVRGLGGW